MNQIRYFFGKEQPIYRRGIHHLLCRRSGALTSDRGGRPRRKNNADCKHTPSLRLFPATPGPHPIALLAHGAAGSKENCFRFGEALAAVGFDCYSVDQAGHGESPHLGPSPTSEEPLDYLKKPNTEQTIQGTTVTR